MNSFPFINKTIRRLSFIKKSELNIRYFNQVECTVLISSSLDLQCETLSIGVENPMIILDFVNRMFTLRSLTFKCLTLGLTGSLPLILVAQGATWKDRGTFNFAFYPFSFKLIWAPLIDALYIKRFGRRKSWLVPIQLSMAGILLLLSFYVESFITNLRIILLTMIFIFLVFLTATQDICVDGLAITLFSVTNPQWASTSQTVGQTFGRFLGSSFLLTFESANFTNRFIRKPLSLPSAASGLFTVEQFIRSAALAIIVVTTCLILFLREKEDVSVSNGEETESLSLLETYLSIWKLFKKKLQSIPTSPLPSHVQKLMNIVCHFITRSTNNKNTVRFLNAQSTIARDQSKIVIIVNSIFAVTIATISNQPARLATSPDKTTKLNVEVQPLPSKPITPSFLIPQHVHFDPQRKETDHDKANLVARSSSSDRK
ncbi:unnamed protein product [Rotaria sp. Silwood2]|nr:unnamed protein product [Rotaria sp. Silwood2]